MFWRRGGSWREKRRRWKEVKRKKRGWGGFTCWVQWWGDETTGFYPRGSFRTNSFSWSTRTKLFSSTEQEHRREVVKKKKNNGEKKKEEEKEESVSSQSKRRRRKEDDGGQREAGVSHDVTGSRDQYLIICDQSELVWHATSWLMHHHEGSASEQHKLY